jgi:hypothetical protein
MKTIAPLPDAPRTTVAKLIHSSAQKLQTRFFWECVFLYNEEVFVIDY